MDSGPLVSIIIPTFNRKRFVGDAIRSCLRQSYDNCEIIVIDDGSTDATEDFLHRNFGDSIHYVYQSNQGPAVARNRGIALARGEFIHFLDADDQLAPEKIERGLQVFRERPQVSVLHTYYQFVAADGLTPLETTPFPQFTDDIFCELLRLSGNHILTSSTMLRAQALRDVGGFADDPQFRSAEDWDLFLRLASKYKFHALNQRLVLRRMHDDMLSDDRLQGALGRLKTVERARDYGWERCMDAAAFHRKLAARHHVLAINWWRRGQRAQARHHFIRAAELHPPEAMQRRLYAIYACCLPPAAMDWTLAFVHALRRLLGRGSVDEPPG